MTDASALPTDTEIPVSSISQHGSSENNSPFSAIFKNKKLLFLVAICLVLISIAIFFLVLVRKQNSYRTAIMATQEAKEAYNSGNLPLTQKKLYESLRAYSANPGGLAALIKSIAVEGNEKGTEADALKRGKQYVDYGLKYFPDEPSVLTSIGYLYETAGEYKKALSYYEQALRKDPNSSEILFHKGHVLEFLGRKDEAYKDYNKAYSLNKDDPYVLMGVGNRLAAEGKAQEAFDTFKKASELPGVSNYVKAEALTGASIVRTGQILYMSEATEIAKKAVEANSKYSPALAAYGYVLSINGNPKEGIEYLKKSIAANPRISRNYSQLSQVYRASKIFIEAINYQKEALARVEADNTLLGPDEKKVAKARYIYDLAKTYDKSGLKVDTMPLLTQAIQTNPLIGSTIKTDFSKYGYFKSLVGNPEFNQLIQ